MTTIDFSYLAFARVHHALLDIIFTVAQEALPLLAAFLHFTFEANRPSSLLSALRNLNFGPQ